jgi:cbb3-type cytochrome oxidase maturation protein
MEVIYGLIPSMLIVGLIAVIIIIWAAKSGQYDDMDGAAYRILNDDEPESDQVPPTKSSTQSSKNRPSANDPC